MAKKTTKKNPDGTVTQWGSKGYEGKVSLGGKTAQPTPRDIVVSSTEEEPSNIWGNFQSRIDSFEKYVKTSGVVRWVTTKDSSVRDIRNRLLRRMIIPGIITTKAVVSGDFLNQPSHAISTTALVGTYTATLLVLANRDERSVYRERELLTSLDSASDTIHQHWRSTHSRYAREFAISTSKLSQSLLKAGRKGLFPRWDTPSDEVVETYLTAPVLKYMDQMEQDSKEIGVLQKVKVKGDIVQLEVTHTNSWSAATTDRLVKLEYNVSTGLLTQLSTEPYVRRRRR